MLADWVIQHFPPHRIYTEVFGGAASVLMRKPRAYAEVYNDIDGELVSLFKVLRDPTQSAELRRLLELTPFARDEFMSSYEASDDPLEQARRTIARSFMGFGSVAHHRKTGFRCDSHGSGRSPANDWINYPPSIDYFTDRLRGVAIENRAAAEILLQQDTPETLHYLDPPYVHETRTGNKGYRHEMTDEDHVELARVAHSLQGMVVLSGYDCGLYRDLYGDWGTSQAETLIQRGSKRVETVWLNLAAVASQRQGVMFG